MRMPICAFIAAVALTVFAFRPSTDRALAAPTPVAAVPVKPIVQIAILLDTSGSMDGLIEQAKTQLWKIVNEFAKAQRDGQHPQIEVALYRYGSPELGADNGYIKQLLPLTDDLDRVSDELFKLRTSGGDEYCGWVIKDAAEQLKWSADKSAYKAMFIAGNEPFTQGSVDYHGACKEAISKGIIVNTIFCGVDKEGIDTFWKDGAMLADGSYMSINQNASSVAVAAPQDKEIAELGSKINTTYVAYGRGGAGGAARQRAQDLNAAATNMPMAAERAITKSSANYSNGTWDLVDALDAKRVELKDIKTEDLPVEMQKLDEKGRQDYVAQKVKERTEIQARIQQLSADRDKFLAEKRKEGGDSTFDAAVLTTVHNQAKNNGMTFPDASKPNP